MANIMITEVCNLRCPYCFANEFVNEPQYVQSGKGIMDIETFKKALDFAVTSPGERVGIIGGEPTIHPQFKEILEILIEDERVPYVVVFTNAINLNKYFEILTHPKIGMLVNCNSPTDLGEDLYKRLVNNLDTAINKFYMKDKISLGINMYKENFEYDYIIDLLKRYNMHHVRTSIAVPNTRDKRTQDPIGYFQRMKPHVLKFFRKLKENDIMPTFDCNIMPLCIPTYEELYWLESFKELESMTKGKKYNLTAGCNCSPVIDILPDLTAVRCFGMSDQEKVPICDFANIMELRNYFVNYYDSYAFKISSHDICRQCDERKRMRCTGGCLAFKANKIKHAKELIEKI